NLDDFLERVAEHPEEEWGSYDGTEEDARINVTLAEELGWDTSDSKLDRDMLRKAFEDGELDDYFDTTPKPETADAFLGQIDDSGACPASWLEDWDEAISQFEFIECVAYRHN